MEIKQYLRVLRAHWLLIAVIVVVSVGAAAAYAVTRDSPYTAHTQLFVSTRSDPGVAPSEVYQGDLAAQSLAQSYAGLVSAPQVAEAVVDELELDRSPESVQSAISASVPEATVLIDVQVEDESAELAKQIADAVATELPQYIAEVEGLPAPEEGSVNVSVTSPAALPTEPDSPPPVGLLGAGLIVGLILGVGAAILRELLDRRVRDDEEAEQVAGAPVLADIPYDSRAAERPLVVISDPDSPEAESYRRLRTNLRVPTLDRNQRSLLVTSPVSGDGKTLIAANLGFVFAQAGHRVVLIDGDLRNPALGRLLGLDPAPGLSEVLSDAGPDLPLRKARELPLETLAAGSPPSNPSDLLESEDFRALLDRLRDRADIVIVDSPALLPVSDAAVMSRAIDGVLLVVRASSTRAEQLDSAADSVRSLGKQPIGVVLNAVRARTGRDYIYAAGGETNAPASTAPDWKV